jgi:hypothetical protein
MEKVAIAGRHHLIQTMICDSGIRRQRNYFQVRECVAPFLRLAKSTGIPVFSLVT